MPRGLVLESSIQTSVVKYARQRGLLAKKLSVQGPMGTSGWPDYMFVGTRPVMFMIEFKKPGGKLTPLQDGIRSQIVDRRWQYYVVDSTEQGRKVIDDELR